MAIIQGDEGFMLEATMHNMSSSSCTSASTSFVKYRFLIFQIPRICRTKLVLFCRIPEDLKRARQIHVDLTTTCTGLNQMPGVADWNFPMGLFAWKAL